MGPLNLRAEWTSGAVCEKAVNGAALARVNPAGEMEVKYPVKPMGRDAPSAWNCLVPPLNEASSLVVRPVDSFSKGVAPILVHAQ
jgi:hypothetical protein